MKWEITGTKDGKSGQWSLEASSEESARRKATTAGVAVSSVRGVDSLPAKIPTPAQQVSSVAAVATRRTVSAEIVDIPPAPAAIQVLSCQNCGSQIGRLETPYVWQGSTVCGACHDKLSGAVARRDASAPAPAAQPGLTMEQLAVLTRAAAAPAPVTHVHVVNQNTTTSQATAKVMVQRRGCFGSLVRLIVLVIVAVFATLAVLLLIGVIASQHR